MRLLLSCLIFLICVGAWAIKPVQSAHDLAVRLMGEDKASQIEFQQIKSEQEPFQLQSDHGKIIISGNTANAMAMGLGHYLKYYCLTNISWNKANSISLPDSLPMVQSPVRRDARVQNRFFLNYCTFGYTMVAMGRVGALYRLDGYQRHQPATGYHGARIGVV